MRVALEAPRPYGPPAVAVTPNNVEISQPFQLHILYLVQMDKAPSVQVVLFVILVTAMLLGDFKADLEAEALEIRGHLQSHQLGRHTHHLYLLESLPFLEEIAPR